MDRYEFNAPKFVDFKAPDKENRDDFFGAVAKKVASPQQVGKAAACETREGSEMDCHTGDTPPQITVLPEPATSDAATEDDLVQTMQVLHVAEGSPAAVASNNQKALPSSGSCKSHIMFTRLDVATGRLVDASQVLDFTEHEGAQSSSAEPTCLAHTAAMAPDLNFHSKREREATNNQTNEHPQKYISMAEAVLKFQLKTPRRFHSRLPGKSTPIAEKPRNPTIPHAPHLMACTRVRHVDYPTREEREAMEVAKINRYKISALPVNPHIFQSPKLGRRVPKFTEPEPFKLTEVKKKEPEAIPQYKFTAQPVPKNVLAPRPSLLGSPRHIVKARHKLDHPKVFASSVQVNNGEEVIVQKEVFNFGVPVQERKNTPLKRSTEIQPFSFEERDKEMARRKEERIKMVFEEEKQARIFHAQPLPNLHRRRLGSTPDLSVMSTDSTVQDCAKENAVSAVFKARPAVVLRKEPFVPRKPDRSPLKPKNFTLKTQARSNERKEYEERVRAEIEEFEELKREYEERQRLEAEAEATANRKLAESFRAQPMPNFKMPKKKLSDKRLTSPESPFTHRSAK